MELDRILREVLELRRGKFEDMGVTVVRQAVPPEVDSPVQERSLGEVVGCIVDTALHALTMAKERRLVIRARTANHGAIVEIEYTNPTDAGESSADANPAAVADLERCRDLLHRWGGRVFLGSPEHCTTRFVVELPRQPEV